MELISFFLPLERLLKLAGNEEEEEEEDGEIQIIFPSSSFSSSSSSSLLIHLGVTRGAKKKKGEKEEGNNFRLSQSGSVCMRSHMSKKEQIIMIERSLLFCWFILYIPGGKIPSLFFLWGFGEWCQIDAY